MNQIGEKIEFEKCYCRDMNFDELLYVLKRNISIYWSWGAHRIIVDKMRKDGYIKMFRFTVSGHHHKGHVYIFLNGLDLFDVYLTTNQGTIKQRTDEMGIYNDQLVEWIDERVERIPEYTR
jgi:hypothetical protein